MINRNEHRGLCWIDLENPTNEEVRSIMNEFDLDPMVAEELLLPSPKPKVELYEHFIYLVLHFPAFKHTHTQGPSQEVDFIIGKKFLITAHYDTIDPLHKFSKVFEVNAILDKEDIGEHAGFLFYHLLRKMYKAIEHELDFMRDELEDIEANIFSGRENKMVSSLSEISRGLLNFKRAMSMHRPILESFEKVCSDFFGSDFSYRARTVLGSYHHIQNSIVSNLDSLMELRETNNSLLATKQNEIMKVITIMAFSTFPLALIADIFGMGAVATPLLGHPFDFWIILGLMGIVGLAFLAYFHRRGWL